MTPAELQAAVDAIPYFYHRIELPHGVVTPGWAPMDPAAYRIPDRLDGKQVLDVGAWDGYWTFEALKRGAKFVAAIDDFSDTLGKVANVDRSDRGRTFKLCAKALGYGSDRTDMFGMSVYNMDFWKHTKWEHVFCFGLLYHLQHPLYALQKLCRAMQPGGTIHIETAILDNCKSAYGDYGYSGDECLFEFYPHDEYGMNNSNWFVGTLRAWAAMVEAAGFTDIETWKLVDTPRSLAEARGFIRAKA